MFRSIPCIVFVLKYMEEPQPGLTSMLESIRPGVVGAESFQWRNADSMSCIFSSFTPVPTKFSHDSPPCTFSSGSLLMSVMFWPSGYSAQEPLALAFSARNAYTVIPLLLCLPCAFNVVLVARFACKRVLRESGRFCGICRFRKKNAKFRCARGRGRPAGRVGGAWGRPRPRAHPNLAFFLFFFLRRGFSKHV